jgi:PAS domain S-box-containing protein
MRSDDHLSIVDSLDDAVVVVDGDRRILAWNATMERCTGRARADALGRPVDDAFGALPPALWTRPIALALAGERGRGPAVTAELRSGPVTFEPQWAPRVGGSGAVLTFRDVTEEAKRALFVRALQTVGRSLAASLDLDQVLDTIAEKTRDVMAADAAMVASWDGRSETLHLLRGAGRLTREYAPSGIPLAGGPVSVAVREGRVVATPDILADPRWELDTVRRRHIAREGFKAVAAAPLIVKGVVRGALAVHQWTARTFTADEMAVLALLAEQAALALENARLYAESQRERYEATALADTARSLALSLDPEEVEDQIADAVVAAFAAHSASLYRIGPDGGLLPVTRSGAGRMKFDRSIVWPRGLGVAGRCVDARRPVWTRDVLTDPSYDLPPVYREAIVALGSRAVLAAPMTVKDRVVGALVITYAAPRDFDDRDVASLRIFADQAALAIENGELYATARADLARLRDSQAQLVQAAKLGALGELVSGVAHELNNPLSVIIGYGQLLLGRDLPATLRRPIELMVSQGDRMAKIVRNLLFFARQRPPERAPVDVNEVLEHALSLRLNQLAVSSITVRREYADSLPTISADGAQLQQVFLNLVLNAEQAIAGAGRPGAIVVRTARGPAGDTVIAQVIDDGPGIAPDVVGRIFEPFFTTKEVGQGTGLGLSVSYGIVQEHGGRLTVDSRPRATTFTVELPVRSAPTAPRVSIASPVLAADERVALVVEDEPAVLDLVVTMLSESGWQVDVAAGGKTGLERVYGRRYDLIVSDIRMPEGGGEEFYRRAVAHDPGLARRFLFVTGDTANPDAWSFLKDANVPVLEKPFAASAFLEAVRAIGLTRSPSPA